MILTQAVLDPDDVELMCDVDDPLAVLRGTDERRRLLAAIMVLVWEAMGFGLSLKASSPKRARGYVAPSYANHGVYERQSTSPLLATSATT